MKKLRITVENKAYDVTVEVLEDKMDSASLPQESYTSARVSSASVETPVASAASTPKPVVAGSGDVVSPMSGVVFKVKVKVGDAVKAGQEVIILEAMWAKSFFTFLPADIIDIWCQLFVYFPKGISWKQSWLRAP